MIRKHLKKFADSEGGVAVESALVLPIFILGVFFFLWIGVTLNDKAALSSAVTRAVRLAATRGSLAGARNQDIHQIADIEDWISSGGATLSTRLQELLVHGVDTQDAFDKFYSASNQTTDVFQRPLYQLPASYTYALVYFNEAIKQSIGSSVRFPCDPNDTDGTDPQHGYGCVECKFLNPSTLDYTFWNSRGPNNGGSILRNDVPAYQVAMDCKFRQASFLIGPLSRLLSIVTGDTSSSIFILNKNASFNAPRS